MDVTVEDVERHLNITNPVDAVEMQAVLDAVVGFVESEIEGPLTAAAYVEVFAAGPVVVLRHAPVVSVDTVAASTGYPVVAATDLVVDLDAGIVTFVSPFRWFGTVTIGYTAGWATTPAPIRMAILLAVADMWETQRGAAALPSLGGSSDAPMSYQPDYALPNRAKEMLAPYRRGPRV